jgi:hypothetical protein
MQSAYIQERRSVPIMVPKEHVLPPSPKSVECSIKNNFDDPIINSPPNEWMTKLMSRIDNYQTANKKCNSAKK